MFGMSVRSVTSHRNPYMLVYLHVPGIGPTYHRNVSNDFSFMRSNTPQSLSSFSAAYNNYTAPPALSYSLLSSTPHPAPSDFIEDENRNTATSEANTLPSTAVSAILPSSLQSFVIGNGSDSSDITEDVSPISVPHLLQR